MKIALPFTFKKHDLFIYLRKQLISALKKLHSVSFEKLDTEK